MCGGEVVDSCYGDAVVAEGAWFFLSASSYHVAGCGFPYVSAFWFWAFPRFCLVAAVCGFLWVPVAVGECGDVWVVFCEGEDCVCEDSIFVGVSCGEGEVFSQGWECGLGGEGIPVEDCSSEGVVEDGFYDFGVVPGELGLKPAA